MSGVGLITRDAPVGRHMAARLERALEGTPDPLRSLMVIRRPGPPLRKRILSKLGRLMPEPKINAKVARYDREARQLFLAEAGPPPDWPADCNIRHVTTVEANTPETVAWQKEFDLKVIVLVGAPVIRKPLLGTASMGVLNLHGSLLPHYRGTQVETWQIYNNDLDKIGLTVHFVEPGIDTGDIILQVPQKAHVSDGPWIIRARNQLSALDAIPTAVRQVLDGTAPRIAQDANVGGPTYRAADITRGVLEGVISAMNREPEE